MAKKLTNQEKRASEVSNVVSKIKQLENAYPLDIIESACAKYKFANVERRKAEKDIEKAERKLAEAKRRLR